MEGTGKTHGICGVCLRLAVQTRSDLLPVIVYDYAIQKNVCQKCCEEVPAQRTVEDWVSLHVRCPVCNVCCDTKMPLDRPDRRDGREFFHGAEMYTEQYCRPSSDGGADAQ